MSAPAIVSRLRGALFALVVALLASIAESSENANRAAVTDDGWTTAEPSKSGFDAERLGTVIAAMMSGETNIHSVLVERHGRLVAESYRAGADRSIYDLFERQIEFGPAVLHDTRSVGKSIVGLLIGIAQERGLLRISQPAIDFYPEHAELSAAEHKAIRLEHLLTMSSGLAWSEGGGFPDDEHRLYWKWSPSRYVLGRPVAGSPGHAFNYNSGGTAVLADILSRVTKTSLQDLARESLFEPMGIRDWKWISDLHGRPMAFTGLRLRPRDMAKIGRLVLDDGRWQGRQLVPANWIRASLEPRVATGIANLHYGYHWWAGSVAWRERRLPWSAAFGNGGQRIFVVRDLDMTVVVTAGAYGDSHVARRVRTFLEEVVSSVQR